MRIEKGIDEYKLSDLYISAALLCNNTAELSGIIFAKDPADRMPKETKKEIRRVLFVLKGDVDIMTIAIKDYFNNKLSVDANLFAYKLQELKTRIYAGF